MKEFELLYCLDPRAIGHVKHVLEAYDNLAVLSTVSAQKGIVRLWGPECSKAEASTLLLELGAQPFDVDA